jgi:Uma2 family endonuclease
MAVEATVPYRFTVKSYLHMAETGVFAQDDRVELIDGEIVEMTPIGNRHNLCVTALNDAFHDSGVDAVIWVQCSIQISVYSQVQPDLALLKSPLKRYSPDRIPQADDVLLVTEVADSSLLYDRNVKAALYAKAGIQEYWLVDLIHSRVSVYRNPTGDAYRSVTQLRSGDTAQPVAFPNCAIQAADLFP